MRAAFFLHRDGFRAKVSPINQQLANSNMVASVARLCQVEEAQNDLAKQCDSLACVIDSLEQRLCQVLRPSAPAVGAQSNAPREMLVPLAENYRSRHDQISVMTARVADMLTRLELP